MKYYCVVSKENVYDRPIQAGRKVLMSFAQMPLWKAFYWIWQQKQTLPQWSKEMADYALKKYANSKEYEVVEYTTIQKEFKTYQKTYKKSRQ